jgi:glycosyltransferase involved in cell wall biosynthesis
MKAHRPLRFCMITTFYPPYSFGGDGIFVFRLSNELARRGHSVDVIHCIDSYLCGGKPPVHNYQDHPNITVHGLKSPLGMFSPLATHQTGYPLFKTAKVKKILQKPFDVIHYHNISLVGGPKILEYGDAIKLYTMLEYWLVCPTNVLFKYNHAPCTKRSCFSCSLTYWRPPQLWRQSKLLEHAINHVDAFIAPSRFSKEIHQKMGLRLPSVYIPYFVPGDSEAPIDTAGFCEDVKEPYFLFVGRLEKLKGLQTLLPIFQRYKKARLLIAGTGAYEPNLRQIANNAPNIKFLGYQTSAKLQLLYRNALGLIAPSICYDAAPLVIFEAFRSRTPVIVRNLGGMPEPVYESGGGFVYDTDEQLLAAMDNLVTDPLCRHRLGELGYSAFTNNWTIDAHLKSYFALIYKIAAKRTRSVSEVALEN